MLANKRKRSRSQVVRSKARKRKSLSELIQLSSQQIRWLTMVAGLLILIGAALWLRSWFVNPMHWPIAKVEIRGELVHIKRNSLDAVIQPYMRTNLYLLDDKNLEVDLEELPWVKAVQLRKSWPQELIVSVEERRPVAYWGDNQLLDEHGEVFNGTLAEKRKDFPKLYSPEDKGREMGENYLKVLKWVKDVPSRVVSLKEDARGSWVIGFENGLRVNTGVQEQEKRIKRFVVGYKKVLNKHLGKISLVDLRYTNGFSVEWK